MTLVPHIYRNSAPHPWMTSIGSTKDMLGFVPGASVRTLEQWQRLGLVELHQFSPGRGTSPVRIAADVLQVAMMREFSLLGVPLQAARHAWACTTEHAFGVAVHQGAVIWVRPDGVVQLRSYGAEGPQIADLPDTITLFRIAPFVARIAARLGI